MFNVKQKVALFVGGMLMVLMLVYPPWVRTFHTDTAAQPDYVHEAGYHLIVTPPSPEVPNHPAYGVMLNIRDLLAQIIALSVLEALLLYSMRSLPAKSGYTLQPYPARKDAGR